MSVAHGSFEIMPWLWRILPWRRGVYVLKTSSSWLHSNGLMSGIDLCWPIPFCKFLCNGNLCLSANSVLLPSSTAGEYSVPGRVALITFASSSSYRGGQGFELWVNAEGTSSSPNVTGLSKDYSSDAQNAGSLRHPAYTGGNYQDGELSMFLINQPSFLWQNSLTEYELFAYGMDNVNDEIAAFTFNFPGGWTMSWM